MFALLEGCKTLSPDDQHMLMRLVVQKHRLELYSALIRMGWQSDPQHISIDLAQQGAIEHVRQEAERNFPIQSFVFIVAVSKGVATNLQYYYDLRSAFPHDPSSGTGVHSADLRVIMLEAGRWCNPDVLEVICRNEKPFRPTLDFFLCTYYALLAVMKRVEE